MPPSRPPAALPYSIALTAIRSFHRLCTLVMIGVRPDGTKELITLEDGYRESAESWTTVLRDLKRRSMGPPGVAVGDGALGF